MGNCIGKVIISTSHELETGITRIKSRTVTDIKHNFFAIIKANVIEMLNEIELDKTARLRFSICQTQPK